MSSTNSLDVTEQSRPKVGGSGKNLILCSDGTGNRGGKGSSTNVWRLYRYVALDSRTREQRTYYHDGVGTDDNKFMKAIGGAFGFGLSSNIRSLYKFLVKNYAPGDSIYLFGFSRGAFTVRSLAGFIASCGILDLDMNGERGAPPTEEQIDEAVTAAFDAYRFAHVAGGRAGKLRSPLYRLSRLLLRGRWGAPLPPKDIKVEHSYGQEPVIKCVGVWDTVSAIGAPMDWMRDVIDDIFCIGFHEHDLSPNIQHGYHALAIDDERHTFSPSLWDEAASQKVIDDTGQRRSRWSDSEAQESDPSIQQVWFAGAHSNVGGGYPKQGMAAVSLYWMMERARDLGLEFEPTAMEEVRRDANVNDRLYDSRSGAGAYYRYRPRDIAQLCQGKLVPKPKPGGGDKREADLAWIHASVFERIHRAPEGYAPGNLPTDFDIDFRGYTAPGVSGDWAEALKQTIAEREKEAEGGRAAGAAAARLANLSGRLGPELHSAYRRGLLEEVRSSIQIRIWLQRVFVAATAVGLVAAYVGLGRPTWPSTASVSEQIWAGVQMIFSAITWMIGSIKSPIESIAKPLAAHFEAAPYATGGVLVLVAAAYTVFYLCNGRVKRRMNEHFRRFWRSVASKIAIKFP